MSADQIAVHRQPLWRARSNYVFHAPTPDVGGAEQLWAERVGDDRFVICCISSEHLLGLAPTRERTQRLQQYLADGEERGAFMCEVGYVPNGER